MYKAELKGRLRMILRVRNGRPSAITAGELSMITESTERNVRLAIRELITEGLPVASTTELPGGYFLVATRQEAEQYAASIRSRLIEDAIRRRDFRRAADMHLTPARQGKLLIPG